MDKRNEFSSPGAEFTPPAEEFPAPPDEFSSGSGRASPKKRRKRLLTLLAAGAAVLALWPLYTASAPTAAPTQALAPASAPASTSAPAPSPTPSPAPTPEPTPSPTPEPVKTEVRAVYLSFSDTLEGAVWFTGQENIRSAHIEIADPQIGKTLDKYDVPADAVAAGFYRLPTMEVYPAYTKYRKDYDKKNAWPDPEIRLSYTYLDETGAETEATLTEPNHYELGMSARYWPKDTDASNPWAYPGRFSVSTYESSEPVAISYSRDDPSAPGEITVWLTIDGRDVDAEHASLDPKEEHYTSGGRDAAWYYGTVVISVPDWAETHGVAHVTIREHLRGYDEIWVTEKDIEY